MAKIKNKRYFNKKIIYIVFGVLFFWFLLSFLNKPLIEYDFTDKKDIGQFKVYNANIKTDKDGINIRSIKNTAILFNTRKQLSKLTWQQNPYIKLNISPEKIDRDIELFWSPNKSLKNIYRRNIHIPSDHNSIIINVAQNFPWLRSPGWKNSIYSNTQINSFGILIPQKYENAFKILKIELLSSLNLLDYGILIIKELLADEGVRVNSINMQYGISILGVQLPYILGIALVIFAIPMLFTFNRKYISVFLYSMLVCFVIYSVPTIHTLINHAIKSSKKSAFYFDKNREYESRFGKQFANLAQEFEKLVPYGSKVNFPMSKYRMVNGESNWISFQYYGLYKISNIKDADYIFYYYPKSLSFDGKNNMVKTNKKQYKFKPIFSSNDNYILKKYDK